MSTKLIFAALALTLLACRTQPPKIDRPDPHKELSVQEMKAIYATEPDPARKFDALVAIVHRYSWQSLNTDEAADAEKQAVKLLQVAADHTNSRNYFSALHHANLTLGRVRLKAGDQAGAAHYLLKSAKVGGSPQLSAFGPNMTLARELLLQKDTKPVLAYLARVKHFWVSPYSDDPLRQWRDDIEMGRMPDFGNNLLY